MKKKQYKVKIDNGQIIPLEPIDLGNIKEGMIVFFEPFEEIAKKNDAIEKKIETLESVIGMLSGLSDEDRLTFEEATKRRSFFKERKK